jgi:hypothetical protein
LKPDDTTFFRDNYVTKYLPDMYKTGEFNGIPQILDLVAPFFDEILQRVIEVPDLVDLDRIPARFLRYLADLIFVMTVEDVWDESQTVDFRRRELGKLTDSHKIRSVEYSFLRLLKYLGADDYGLIIPRRNICFLDVTPLDGLNVQGDQNDVLELLDPVTYDISSLCNGWIDNNGEVQGDRIEWTIPTTQSDPSYLVQWPLPCPDYAGPIRGFVKVTWRQKEIPLSFDRAEDYVEYTYYFHRGTTSYIHTNFIPLQGDQLLVTLEGDPYWHQSFYTEDAWYWRPGVTEVYSDVNPLLRRTALEDRRPIGTLLYFTWLLRFYIPKWFPNGTCGWTFAKPPGYVDPDVNLIPQTPPAIDYERVGYTPILPPHQLDTWNSSTPHDTPDPWFFEISNGYGWEAFWEERGELSHQREIPFEVSWSRTGEMQFGSEGEDFNFFARSDKDGSFQLRIE